MSIYQRCLSKSLIFFSIVFIVFVLLIESNIGFKWIINFTSRFFVGFKVEEISGNWRDFTLKNIKFNISGISIQADSIHMILDSRSLFKKSTIFKDIKTKNLIISSKKNISPDILKKNISPDILKKNIFTKYPIIFQNIHINKIFFKSSKVHIFFSNVLSKVELINNNIVFFPTYINNIDVVSSRINVKKKNIINKLTLKKKINNFKEIYGVLDFFSPEKKILIPFNIDFKSLQCKKIKFLDYKNSSSFQIHTKAKIANNILTIQRMKIESSFLKIKSNGKIIFNSDNSISFNINNKIFIPIFHNRIINFIFKANLNDKFTFELTSQDLYKIQIYGSIFLNSADYPFFMKLQIKNLLLSINKSHNLKLNSLKGFLRGKINNYYLSFKNIFTIQHLPSMFMNIQAKGNLKNIFLKKITFLPIKKTQFYRKIIYSKNNLKHNPYMFNLIGIMKIIGQFNENIHNLDVPHIYLNGEIMKKKVSILGSLYYRNFNLLNTRGINLFLGKNKLHLKGFLGKKYNIHSFIDAHNLDYFCPNLQGTIRAKANFYGDHLFSTMTGKILSHNLHWNSIFLKSMKMFTKININNKSSGGILIDAKKINIDNFFINTLHMRIHFNDHKQKFFLLLKSHTLYIKLIINGIFNKTTGDWHGFCKKINIRTLWGKITSKTKTLIDYHDSNNIINNFYQENIKKRDMLLSFLYNTKMSFFNIFKKSLISFKSDLSIDAKSKSILVKKISNGRIFIVGHNIKIEKKINKKIFFQNIDFFKISIDLIKNNFKSKLTVKKLLEKSNIIGYLNILDIYNKKKITGELTISNFSMSFMKFFTNNFKQVNGILEGQIKFLGTLYQPKVLADVSFRNVFIRSDNILKYMTLFMPYFPSMINTMKINQEIMISKGNILFTLNSFFKNPTDVEWTIVFNSKRISVSILPKMKLKFSSQLNLHYLHSKYDLIGYIKFSFFYFKIYEKNFTL